MQRYEYKVVPAPQKATKAKGVKSPEARFATTVEQLLNQLGQEGWEYQRAELLPSEERSGLTGSTTHWRNVLVFRRALLEAESVATVAPVASEADATPLAQPIPGPEEMKAPEPIAEEADEPPLTLKSKQDDASQKPSD